ncbi:phosphohydrolase [Bizionia argentinensis JUB59]|uniref:Phosphohydrolase n=1 Tax=Bizionia argentinensis JUB59 TaxID=1046627 RepID=G2E923_9FLAO|nr:phosphohydrolase [Bizionia argentinensis]EGV45048.1 phosphohydrolase [Bizionia argentinensis JUB59]
MTRIKSTFEQLILRLGNSKIIASKKWEIISNAYNSSSRFYHNLNHLESMLLELEKVKNEIKDWDLILFSLFYHDIIYDSTTTDNEEKSAEFAKHQLGYLNISVEQIEKVQKTILATKSHVFDNDQDINFFLDADISILGADKDFYEMYSRNIRLEYLEYPSFIFNKGRSKVLEHFLSQTSIYKTYFFKNQFETKAIENLKNELKELKRRNQVFSRTNTNEYVKYLEFDGDLSEFFYNSAKILDQTKNIETIDYYPGWYDSGYYRFIFKGTSLHLEYDGMLGTLLRTEPEPSIEDKSNAEEVFVKLLDVRLTKEDLERVRKFNTFNQHHQIVDLVN